MWAPGLIGCVIGLFVLAAVRDKPADLGYPPVDAPAATSAAAQDKPRSSGGNMMSALSSVLKLPSIWALAFTYFFIYVVRQGVTSWLVFYLMAEKGAADAGSAALTVSGLELGGLAGSTVAGFLSDRAIRGAKAGSGLVGKRIKVWKVGCFTALLLHENPPDHIQLHHLLSPLHCSPEYCQTCASCGENCSQSINVLVLSCRRWSWPTL